MYAVIATGGKQYRVETGETLEIELLPAANGEQITFDQVLMIGQGADVQIGRPFVSGAVVTATLLGRTKGPKLIAFKHSGKTTLRRKTGHRQKYTRVRIDSISLS